MKRTGLFGGTFDPVHKGHIMVAEIAKKEMDLDEVIFVPAGNPPHKTDKKIADGKDRLNMLLLATGDIPYFKVCDAEIKKKEKSYSVDLIKHFKEKLQETELFFIIGADSLYNLPTWYNYEELMQMTNFIVISRPETNKSSLLDKFSGNEKPMRAFFIDDVSIDISSTEIRKMLKSGADTEKYLDKSVLNYIRANRLY
ncbi:MAG: nicotinate-nucleotide adenylyltransferase [Ruminococcaceae bacterium]|nr:nicotinate-nucleotide adenylyltransferase [Oscillospiraceae bacterium]